MADLRDDSVVRASYFNQLLDFQGTDLKKVYEPVSNQIGYLLTFAVFCMIFHFAWKRYKKWKEESSSKRVPYKVIKPPSAMVSEQQAGEGRKRVCAVVGGTGFIGSHLVNELIRRKNYYVFVLGRTFRPERTNPDADCLIQVDVLDVDGLVNAFQGVESVFNAAAVIPHAFISADQVYRKNRLAYANVLEAAKKAGVKRLVQLSGFHTSTKLKDPSMVAFMKAMLSAEEDTLAANGDESGIQTCVVGPTNILGSNSPFFDKLVSGEMTSCPMSDKMPVSFMPVEYLTRALANAEEKLTSPATASEVAGKLFELEGERMSWRTLLTLPAWTQKISPTPNWLMWSLTRLNVVCAVLLGWAPLGADLCPGLMEIVEVVEEEVPEEEVQQVYKVLGVGPPHPPVAEYIEQLVQQHKDKLEKEKEEKKKED